MNKNIVKKLNLSSNEGQVLRVLFEYDNLSASDIAKKTGLKRTTVYNICGSLSEQGLASEDDTKRPAQYSLATPREIEQYAKDEEAKNRRKVNAYTALAAEVSRKKNSHASHIPQVRFVQEKELERFLKSRLGVWHDSMDLIDSTCWGFQDTSFVDCFGDMIKWDWKENNEMFFVKLLSNKSGGERRLEGKCKRREMKYFAKSESFESTTWVAGEYVVHINTKNRPFHLVEIKDPLLANDMRNMFKLLWDIVS